MDKVTAKLDKAQQTVQVNETEYKNYLKALKDTNTKWTTDWKAWCDVRIYPKFLLVPAIKMICILMYNS